MMQSFWSAFTAAIVNHLWQSTLFALAAVAVTLTLRNNHASVRYQIWLAASVKFLIPFSLLVTIGEQVAGRYLPAHGPGGFFATVRAMGEPFTLHVTAIARPAAAHYFFLLAAVWLCGFVAVLAIWSLRWGQVYAAKRSADLMSTGRELNALRDLERTAAVQKPMALLLSQSRLEPGVFGIFRPVLLWPAAVSSHLEDHHLQAILAHEMTHARRRDNLLAAIHMIVEAIFWFHPLVWWLGVRLVDERERACDEAVLLTGHAPEIYAESILKTCAFCVASPVACVAGVTGAELQQRVVRIMAQRGIKKLSGARKVLLASLGVSVVAGPFVVGFVSTPLVNAQSQPDATPRVYHIGGDVLAPKLIDAPDPEFTEEAKRAKYEGVCVLALVVDAKGNPQQIHVIRHLQYGLDGKAIEALKQYKFEPGTLHGKPVAVEVNVEMNFRLY